MSKKIFIKTFGCQMNEYDTNRIFDTVREIGFIKTENLGEAKCYLLNTCHIRDKAKEKVIDESLRDWFKKEDWVRINTSGNITGACGTMKKGKATTRCLPRKKAQSLTKAERKATVAKKVRGSKKGKQFVKNTDKAEFKKK